MSALIFFAPGPERDHLAAMVRASGYGILFADSEKQASAKFQPDRCRVAIVDLAAGADALRFLRKRPQANALPVICVADRRQPAVSSEALRLGVADILGRPLNCEDLETALSNARELRRVAEEPAPRFDMPEPPDGIFGASPAMRDVLAIVRQVAHSRCGVLVVGERGSGRATIARAIHSQGASRDEPFVPVNCAEPESNEIRDVREGRVAPGATVFLSELCDLSADLQAALEARVGNSEGVTRAGSPRFIASAQPSITDLMERGVLRRSLVEAIAFVRIDLPPLRERPHDIPFLASHFLKDACRRGGTPPKTFTRGALALLESLPWSGNVSELRSQAERLAVLVPRGIVLLEDVLANVRLDGGQTLGSGRGPLKEARERFERDYITAVLQRHHGRMGHAARELGIERTNLYRKIKSLNIRWTLRETLNRNREP